jgi:alpha-beta hydrolase superfamily lysophospholipase
VLTLYRFWFRIGSWCWPGWSARQAFQLFITPRLRVTKPLPPSFAKANQLSLIESEGCCRGWHWNPGGTRRILVLHGFSSAARNFAHLIDALVERNMEVIAFDAPAHGLSEGKQIHSLQYRKFIQAIREKWGPFDGYIAHSFGGLSISLALEENPPNAQERLVLIAPATETRSALQQLQQTLLLRKNIMQRIDQLIEERSGRTVSWFSVNRVIEKLTIPIFWIHDRSDDVTPYEDIEPSQHRSAENVQFHITDGLGHRRVYRDPAVCEKIIQFLTQR